MNRIKFGFKLLEGLDFFIQQNPFFVLCTPPTLPHLCIIKENKRGGDVKMTGNEMTRFHCSTHTCHFS